MSKQYNFQNLTGQKFGRLTVVCRAENKNGRTMWHCKCECGNEKDIIATSLTRGLTKSCGCFHNEDLSNRKLNDLTGKKFGRLLVIERAENRGRQTYWKCRCDCGKIKEINGAKLKNGHTKSCGCLPRKAKVKSDVQRSCHLKTHGMSETRIYRIYHKMKLRCYSKVNPAYPAYGGRGITICDEWLNDFMEFYNWSMDNGYADDLSIDRIDNNKGYSPDNCRWTTKKQQANNTRSTIFLTYKGETKPASEWSEITGIPQDTLTYRKRSGWSDDECIETPLWGRMGKKRQ